jgi:hypothetical protein
MSEACYIHKKHMDVISVNKRNLVSVYCAGRDIDKCFIEER